MMRRFDTGLKRALLCAGLAAAVPLGACKFDGGSRSDSAYALPDLPATLPLAPGYAGQPDHAPAVAALPSAPLIRAVRVADPGQAYAYADDAWGFDDALGEAPPDYGFYYDEVEPWAWEGYDQSLAFVEPLEDGYRYYYYRPGEEEPYFIRDPDWGYGYDDGRLAVVYGPDWQIVPYAAYGPRLDYASRYYARGRNLYRAAHQRHPVIVGNWIERGRAIAGQHEVWAQQRARREAWQAYHQRTERQQARHWAEERARRQADMVRFAAWRERDFRTPPPPRAIPVAWTAAKWARDERRFAPPARGFAGNEAQQRRAAAVERSRVAGTGRLAQLRADHAPQGPAQLRAPRMLERLARRQEAADRLAQPTAGQRAADRALALRAQRDELRREAEARRVQAAAQQQDRRARIEIQRPLRAEAMQEQAARQAQASERAAAVRAEAQQRRQAQEQVQARSQQHREAAMRQRVEAAQPPQVRVEAEQRRQEVRAAAAQRQSVREPVQQRGQVQAQARVEAPQGRQAQRAQAAERIQARAQQREEAKQQRQEARQARVAGGARGGE